MSKTLAANMAEVMEKVGYVQKDATNDFQKYTYASAQAVFDKVRKELSARGIAVGGDVGLVASEIVGSKDKHLVVAKHTLTFTDGTDTLSVSALGEGIDAGDKASMKSNTAGVKYCLAKAFLISWGDDPEADTSSDGAGQSMKMTSEQVTNTASWIDVCEEESATTYDEFSKWWPTHKVNIKNGCGIDGAATVYEQFTTYLARLKAEVDEAA